jgi:hypothetical protein
MSCRRKLLITEEERIGILSLYDIVEQVTPAGKNEYTMSGQSFFDDGKYSGFSKKDEKKLKSDLEGAANFLRNNKGRITYVKVIASESQVTNYDREKYPSTGKSEDFTEEKSLKPLELSRLRAETMKNYLKQYFSSLKSQNVISEMPIFEPSELILGNTKYVKGQSNKNNPDYDKERYVKVILAIKPPEECIIGLTVEVMYKKDKSSQPSIGTDGRPFSCRGDHDCDVALFDVKLNGVSIGKANLNNGEKNPPIGGDRTSGKLVVDDAKAKAIIGNESKDIVISLQCLSPSDCHSDRPEVRISKGNTVLFHQCTPAIGRGVTGDIKILELDNCGNLKKKGVDSGQPTKVDSPSNKNLPKLTGNVKKLEMLNPEKTTNFYIENGIINKKPESDGTYIVLKYFKHTPTNTEWFAGDKLKVIPKTETSTIVIKPIIVNTTNNDSVKVATDKFINGGFFGKTPNTDGSYTLLKDAGYNGKMYKTGQHIIFQKPTT